MSLPTLAEAASALITVFEGNKLKAYRDSGGVWTNGIGNTHNVSPNSTITEEQSLEDFTRNQAALLAKVTGYPVLAAAAYASFGFNCGSGALNKVLSGADTIDNPVHTTDRHGNVLEGLKARRKLEMLLINFYKE